MHLCGVRVCLLCAVYFTGVQCPESEYVRGGTQNVPFRGSETVPESGECVYVELLREGPPGDLQSTTVMRTVMAATQMGRQCIITV